MLTHTSTFETLAVAPVKQTDVIVVRQTGTPYADDNTMKWTSSTVLMSVIIDAVGEMLGSTTKKATVKLLGIVSGVSASDVFQIRHGLYNSATSAFVYVSQGFYIVDTVDYDYDSKSTTVTMYDHMWTAGKTLYSDVVSLGDLSYPATVGSLAGMIASKLGVTLMSGFGSLPNASYSIVADLYSTISNATLQTVVQEVAGATGTTARITDTTLTFSQYSVTSENLGSTSLKTLKIGNTYGPINSLVLGRVPQNDNIALFSQPLGGLTVGSVNATTNLFTITAHHLLDGDMVQFSSTGTLPAPLVANTSYYVYTAGNVNTFAVVPSYAEATQPQYALNFNGSHSISVPHSTTLDISDNFSAFATIRTTGDTDRIINKWSSLGWLMDTNPTGNLRVRVFDGTNNIDYNTTAVNDGNWHIVGFTYTRGSATGLKLYVDGVQVGVSQDTTAFTTAITNTSVVGIADIPSTTGTRFVGDIDNPMIYNRVLSDAEIAAYRYSVVPTGPVMRLNFNEGSGTAVADSSGNGNNGTITGATWVTNRNIVDLTTAGTGTITIPSTVTKEIQINNNEILDDDRATLIVPLYNRLSGIYWSEVKSDTVGLGWHEVGDVILFTQGSVTVRAFLNEVHLTLAASVKETLVSNIPEATAINYQTAGGILKTLYNAEIKVDKQANEITSIVSEQQIVNDQVQTDFTEIRQDVDSIDINIQNSGGNNLLLNSVGYATDKVPDDAAVDYLKLSSWDYKGLDGASVANYVVATHGTVLSDDSSASQNAGGVSGRSIRFVSNYATGKGIRLTQRVKVAVGAPLSFGLRAYSGGSLGTATVVISNTNESGTITINNSAHNWEEFTIENFTATLPWLDVIIESKASGMEFTDLRLMYGVTIQKWTQADTELMSTNVQFTTEGMRVYDPNKDMETHVTNNAFQTIRRSDGVILLEADDTGVRANDFTIRGSSDYETEGVSVIKQITIPVDDPKGGIAFLKGTE